MRRIKLLALSGLLIAAGCAGSAGNAARERALLPTLQSRWPAVEEDVARGIADGVDDGEISTETSEDLAASSQRLEDALDQPLPVARQIVPMEWSILHPWASRGVLDRVDDGEIGPGVGDSFDERIKQFNAAVQRLQEAR